MPKCKQHWDGGLQAEKEADVIIWDGGNNDMPFFRPGADSPSAHGLRAPCRAEAAKAFQYSGNQAAKTLLSLLCASTFHGRGQGL